MTDKPFSWDLPFTTRDGRKARLLANDIAGGFYAVALAEPKMKGGDPKENVTIYNPDGSIWCRDRTELNLINTSTKRTVYLVVADSNNAAGRWWISAEMAAVDRAAYPLDENVRIIPVEIEG